MTHPILSDHRAHILDTNGNIEVPFADGTYYTIDYLPENFMKSQFYIRAVDTSNNIVTPTAGSITVQCSPIGGQWHDIEDGSINATDIGASGSYTIPCIPLYFRQARITTSGVTATNLAYLEAYFIRVFV